MKTIHLRQFQKTDHDFIIKSWATSYQATSYMAIPIEKDTFLRNHAKIIADVLNSPKTKCLIAGDNDNFTINSFMVYEENPSIIHYIYTREAYRKLGIAKTLIKESNIDLTKETEITHWNTFTNLIRSKYKITHNPYPFFCEVSNGQ